MDLNMMLRAQAAAGLQAQLDSAVTNGDTETARKVAAEIAKFEVATQPKAAPAGISEADIRAQLDKKTDWFGVDPKKSDKAVAFGKAMDPKRFSSAEAYADALIKAVDAEFAAPVVSDEPDEPDDEPEEKPAPKKQRASDGPRDEDTSGRVSANRATGAAWTKMSQAPRDVQSEINRQADKFVKAGDKEARAAFVQRALATHHAIAQKKAGK